MGNFKRYIALKGGFHVACNYRHIDSADALVFIHGFGSAKEHFRHAFNASSLRSFSIVAIDLVGFGESRGPANFGYTMEDQARVMLKILSKLKIESSHLCGHSMGGLVAMKMAELEPLRVRSLINMEGNLTPEDCTLSGTVVKFTPEEFTNQRRREFEEELRKANAADPSFIEYMETFRIASTMALLKSAAHTVAESSTPLVDRLARIKNSCYIYGEKNKGLFPGEKLLGEKGVPVFYVKDAGHAMATDNPEELCRIIYSFIDAIRHS